MWLKLSAQGSSLQYSLHLHSTVSLNFLVCKNVSDVSQNWLQGPWGVEEKLRMEIVDVLWTLQWPLLGQLDLLCASALSPMVLFFVPLRRFNLSEAACTPSVNSAFFP